MRSPKSLAQAKLAVGMPDYGFEGLDIRNPYPNLDMVSSEKERSELTPREVSHLRQATRGYLFGPSDRFAAFETAIDKLILHDLEANGE